ncbi:MAG: leucine-rich repeat protein [Bacteroidaceae bacterium]|nr:leucine-rich repeat protein [Bacteroidaceae bacterium]
MKKRLLLLLCLLTAAGSAAWAEIAHGDCKNGSWVIDDSGKLTLNITGAMADYSGTNTVTSAKWGEFWDQIKAIHVGDGCTEIGKCAFKGLEKVTSITGCKNVTRIHSFAFECVGNPNMSVTFPSVTRVDEKGFRYCLFAKIVLPVVETTGSLAFADSPLLLQVDLGSKIKEIGLLAFSKCPMMFYDDTPNIFMSNPTPPTVQTLIEVSTAEKIKTFFEDAGKALTVAIAYLSIVGIGPLCYAYGQDQAKWEARRKEEGLPFQQPYERFFGLDDIKDEYHSPFYPRPDAEEWGGGLPIVCVPYDLVETYRNRYDGCDGCIGYYKQEENYGEIIPGGYMDATNRTGWWYLGVSGASMNELRNRTDYNGFDVFPVSTYENEDYVSKLVPLNKFDALCFGGDMKSSGMSVINAQKSQAKLLAIGSNSTFPEGAFQGWTNIEYVTLGKDAEMSNNMFKGCTGLKEVKNYSTKSIPFSAFEGCTNLTYFINESNGINTVYSKAFKDCKRLVGIKLPAVKYICDQAFMNCSELSYVYSSGIVNPKYSYSYDIEKIGESAFEGCPRLREISLQNLQTLGKRAFYGCKALYEFCPGPYFSDIPEEAFASTGIVRIKTSGAHCFNFGPKSFADTDLDKIGFDIKSRGIFTDNVDAQRLGDVASDAFYGLELKDIPLHCSYQAYETYKKDEVLSQMNFRPYDVEFSRWSVAKDGWELTSSGILTVGNNSYFMYKEKPEQYPWHPYRDLIRKVIVDDGQTTIYPCEFAGLTELTSVLIPRSVKNIKNEAFSGCTKLKNIYISSVERLGNNVFEDCTSLEEIEMDDKLASAGDYIFKGCKNLTDIYNKSEDPAVVTELTFAKIGSPVYSTRRNANGEMTYATNLHVPRSAVLNYMIDDNWNKLHIAYADERGTWAKAGKFGDGAWILYDDSTMVVCANKGLPAGSSYEVVQKELKFAANPNDPKDNEPKLQTKRLEIDGNITELGACFEGFKNLEEVVMKAPVRKLDATFRACEKLANISTASLEEIGSYTFSGTALTNLSLPAAKLIGIGAFQNCSKLQTVQLGPSCELKASVFQGCTSLTNIDLSTATTNGGWLFKGCTSLKGVIFHGTRVGESMFEGCTALEEIDLGENVRTIGNYAFGGCDSLKTIYISSPTPAQLWKVNDNVTIDGTTQNKRVSPFTNTTDYTDLDYKQIEVQVPKTFIIAYTSTKYLWPEMKIVMDEDYVEDLLPTGGSLYGNGKGTSGQHVASGSSWNLDIDGTLTIDAAGEIAKYRSDNILYGGTPDVWAFTFQPWLYFIHNIVVTDDVTDLPANMFWGQWLGVYGDISNASAGVKSVTLGEKVKSVGDYTLNFSGLTDVYVYSEDWVDFDANCFDTDALVANNATLHLVTTLPDNYFNSYQGWLGTRYFPNIVRDLEPIDPKMQAIHFPMAELTMYVGQSIQLEPQFTPSNVKNKTLRYNNLLHNYNVTIDENGVMTALNEGKAYIEAYSSYTINGEELQATWGPLDEIYLKVTITEEPEPEPVFFDVFAYPASDAPWTTFHVLQDEYIDVDTQIKTCEVAGQYNEDDVTTQAIPEWMTGSAVIPEEANGYEVVRIGAYAFYEREISAVWIPWTVTHIGYNAFASCYRLKDVSIPSYEPLRLTNAYGEEDENLWNNDAFYRVGEDVGGAILHIPAGSYDAWNIYPWNEWFRFIVEDATIPDGIGSITPDASPMRVESWFDLSGRKLGNSRPTKPGLYIIGGKKVVIK